MLTTGHHLHGNGDKTWLTPPHILKALGPFDLDPCACPEPRPWPTANHHYALPQNGLSLPWEGRIFLNPPYDNDGWIWLKKLAIHNDGIALVFARTETTGFVNTVWKAASAIMFLHGRLTFHYKSGKLGRTNAGAPSCLVAYGDKNSECLRACGLPGTFILIKKPVV